MSKASIGVNDIPVRTGSDDERRPSISNVWVEDNVLLAKLGYKSEFRREFSV